MKALILAAGYGTRLYSVAKDTPKALLDINGRPLINYTLDKIEHLNSLDEIIVVTNNKFYDTFVKWASDLKGYLHNIRVVNDGTDSPEQRLGSIGDIQFSIETESIDDDLLVVGSDNLFDYTLDKYIIDSQAKPESVTIGLYDIENLEQAKLFGVVSIDENQKVVSFQEKPADPKSSLIAMCCYYFPQKTLGLIHQYLKETEVSDTAGDYIRWLNEKFDVYGFKFVGKWYDIGSVESYKEAQDKFK